MGNVLDRRGELRHAAVALVRLDDEPVASTDAKASRREGAGEIYGRAAAQEGRVESVLEEDVGDHGGDGRLAARARDRDRAALRGQGREEGAPPDPRDAERLRALEVRIRRLHGGGMHERVEPRHDAGAVLRQEQDARFLQRIEDRELEPAVPVAVGAGDPRAEKRRELGHRGHPASTDTAEVVPPRGEGFHAGSLASRGHRVKNGLRDARGASKPD